jgi:MFS family permease
VLLSGATWTVFLLARQGFMIDVVPAGMRARALSTLGGTFRMGLLLGPLLGSVVIAVGGLAAVFWTATLTSAAAGVLAVLVREPPTAAAAPAAGHAAGHDAPQRVLQVLLEHRGVLLGLGSAVVVIGTVRSLRTSLLPLWAESVGLSPEQVSLLFAVASGVDVALFYPAGLAMDRYGRTGVAVAVAATISLGVLLLPLATGFATVLAVAVVMAVGNGLGAGIVMTLGADSAPVRGRSQFLGGWRLAGDVGSTGGPLLVSAAAAVAPLAVACLLTGGLGLLGAGWVARQVARAERRRAVTMVP